MRIVALTLILISSGGLFAGTWDIQEQIALLGEDVGQPITNGFFFLAGRYVETPYYVSRKGSAVFLNTNMLYGSCVEWPPRDKLVPVDPGMPTGLTENATFEDLYQIGRTNSWDCAWYRKCRYVRQHVPTRQVIEEIMQLYRALPFVDSVERLDAAQIKVRTKAGAERDFWVAPPAEPLETEAELRAAMLELTSMRREFFAAGLQKGCCLIQIESSTRRIPRDRLARELVPIVEALKSNKSRQEKIAALNALGIGGLADDEAARMIDTFVMTPQLAERLKAL